MAPQTLPRLRSYERVPCVPGMTRRRLAAAVSPHVVQCTELHEFKKFSQTSFLVRALSNDIAAAIAADIRPDFIKRLTDHLDGIWPECGVFDQCPGFHDGRPRLIAIPEQP